MNRPLFLLTTALLVLSACRRAGVPQPGSKTYSDLCSAFFLGLAGLQSGEDVRAKEYLTRSTQIAPGEPAGWADLGILQMRQQQFDQAYSSVDQARGLAPDNSRLEALLGLIESRRGKLPEAIGHFKKAVQLDGNNLQAIFSLAAETERQPGPDSERAAGQLLRDILKHQPENAAVLLEDVRIAAKRGDAAEIQHALSALGPQSVAWPEPAKQQLSVLQQAAAAGNVRPLAVQVQFLRNVLARVPSYRSSLDAVKTPATLVARPFLTFLRVATPTSQAAAPDYTTEMKSTPLPDGLVTWIGTLGLDDQHDRAVVWADATSVHMPGGALLPLPGKANASLPKHALAAADLNYDFKADIVVATAAGLRIFEQLAAQQFRDVTAAAKLPPAVVSASYSGVWAMDVDLDGDLDLVLGTAGEPLVLRNNADGTFTPIHSFTGVSGIRALAIADIDSDGDPDVALIDGSGALHVFLNERLGQYRRVDAPAGLTQIADVQAADINGDGWLDYVLLRNDGSVVRLSQKDGHGEWESAVLVAPTDAAAADLSIADLDNNGALDLIVGQQVFLSDGTQFKPLSKKLAGVPRGFTVLNASGLLDAVALDANNHGVLLKNSGSKHYHWQTIRTRAAHALGDQRINSFGIGGEIELRADLFTQKQVIDTPVLHFGLGEHPDVQFARIVWPNGSVQAEFELKGDQSLLAEQRIKGSCPMLFAWNGREMQFLKDVGPWGSALGLNVNAQGKGIYGTREWFRIRGDQLVAKDGIYDLRITAEYWETYYMDHYSLLVVDHAPGTEVFTDERFSLPPPKPSLVVTGPTRPFACAIDDNGRDVTEIVRALDNRFLDTFGRGQYQGLTRDHWVELQLPDDAPQNGPLYLVGQGWIHDTDATIVQAQAQNSKAHPQGLSIAVPDANGHWFTARQGLGFPKGRVKTVVLDITGIFQPGAPRKLRLRTNLELYWDKLEWAPGVPDGPKTLHLDLSAASLRYRGFSLITRANDSSPELPHYDVVQQSALHWQSQEGYATRYGDVLPLLRNIDDRYVITSPGDELRMQFTAPAAPPSGWKRDYILVGDGWVKDGDYNSTFGGTIQPLPYHAMTDYTVAPAALEDDPAYRLHPSDWQQYHTRYLTSDDFLTALKGSY